jgi:MFS family permease
MTYRPSRNVVLLGLTSFLNDLSSEMILSVFPAFFISVLKAGAGSLGLVEGIAEGASNFIKIYAGRLSDSMRTHKPFILFGYTLSVLTRPLYLFVGDLPEVIGLRFLDRVGKGLRDGPRDGVISLSTPKRQMGRAFGFHRAFDTAGAIIGPLIVYFILRADPEAFKTVFLTAFVIGILAVLSVLFIKDVIDGLRDEKLSLAKLSMFSRDFKRYLLALFFLSAGSIPVAVLLLSTQGIGLSIASIPLFYMVYNVSFAGFSFSAGRLSDRFGAQKMIGIGYLLLLLGYMSLTYAFNPFTLGAAFLLLGFFSATTDGVQRALASHLSSTEHRAGAMGLTNAVAGLGLMIAGIGGGYLWQHAGATIALMIAGSSVVLGVLLLIALVPNVHYKK